MELACQRIGAEICKAGRRYSVEWGLSSLAFGFVLGLVLGLVFLGGLRQRLYEWWIGVELGAGASPHGFLVVLAPGPLDALQMGNA